MTLLHRVGAGLILMGGLLPAQVNAGWPWFGRDCGCSAPPPVASCGPICQPAPMMAPPPVMYPQAAPCCGGQPHLGRLPRQRHRNTMVYRSRTRIRMHGHGMDNSYFGAPMMGAPAMGFPSTGCGCGASASMPMIMPEQSIIVPQSSMMSQPVITYQNVPKTVMRQEAVQVQVPTTTYQQVAVDEGSFQQVWVPRMVTKSVPRTVMTTQVQYRQVPQTVYEQVPQFSSTSGTFGSSFAQGPSFPIATPTTVTPSQDFNTPTPVNPVPTPMGETATAPQAAPQTSQVQEWQKVRQRSSTIEQQSYEYESKDTSSGYLVPKAAGRFSSSRR
ncbi:MAG: hypothetical protein DWH81_05480 [Planctomycetota bacterium]|nr:MAG: hypothetical protein DWH81_05480 [Planctomycetota bacterium]